MTVLSSWLWWRVEGHSSHMLPGPVPAHNCVASTGLDGAEQTAWHWSHTGSGPSTLVTLVVVSSLPPAQHLQPHTGEAEAGLHLASTGDIGDTGVRRRERCPGGRPGTAGAGRVVVAVCCLLL